MMLFKVYYRFYASDGSCTRGGECSLRESSVGAAEQEFHNMAALTTEYKNGDKLEFHTARMFTEYLSWDDAIEALADMSAVEIDELLAAVNAAKAEVK